MLVQRVFWPEGLSLALRNDKSIQVLYGWQLPAPSGTSIGRPDTASYIVVGSLALDTSTDAVLRSLGHVRHQLGQCGVEQKVVILGSWTPQANLTADLSRLRQDMVLPSDRLIRTYGYACDATSPASATTALIPGLLRDGSSPYHSHQVFLYTMPQPGTSHFPVPPDNGQTAQSSSWPWMSEQHGPSPLEQAQHFLNHASWVQQAMCSSVSGSAAAGAADRATQAAARRSWVAAKLAGPGSPPQPSWLAATATGSQVLRKTRGWFSRPAAVQAQPDARQYNQQQLACERAICAELAQHVLGLLLAWLLLSWQAQIWQHSVALGHWVIHSVMEPNIAWLMTAKPGGLKLHAELTVLYGTAVSSATAAAQHVYAAAWQPAFTVLLHLLAATSVLLGLAPAAALAADLALLLAAPLELQYLLLAKVYSLQLYYVGATWRLMRGTAGRKFWRRQVAVPATPPPQNSLWGNTDKGRADEVTVEHLIVGVLLFTPLLALLPTTAVWYAFLLLLHCSLAAVRVVLYKLSWPLRSNGLYCVVRRLLRPQLFPGSVMVEPLDCRQQVQQVQQGNVGASSGSRTAGPVTRSARKARAVEVDEGSCIAVSRCYRLFVQPVAVGQQMLQLCSELLTAQDRGRAAGLLGAMLRGTWFGLLWHM